jgi:hypothetical protein
MDYDLYSRYNKLFEVRKQHAPQLKRWGCRKTPEVAPNFDKMI